jgi:Holliday junction resolvase Gen1 C-terminal domain
VDGNHSTIYTSADILAHPSVQLTRGGLILIGLLSGGDYHTAGLSRCGPGIAHGLAKCGLGDELLEAAQSLTRAELTDFLTTWRQALRDELRTNSRGHLGSKKPSLAKAVPDSFPDVDILLSYTNPIISATDAGARRTHTPPRWEREPDLAKIAHVCELHFEWGLRDVIIKRFRTVLWPSIVLRALRRSTLEAAAAATVAVLPSTPVKDNESHRNVMGTPSKLLARHFSSIDLGGGDNLGDLIVKIHGSRTHAYTDGILEYRLEIAPASLVRLASAGIQGLRKPADTTYDVQPSESDEESEDLDDDNEGAGTGKKKKRRGGGQPPEPDSHLRVWMPACMVRLAHPELVRKYEAALEAKRAKKSSRGTRGRTKNANGASTLPKKVGKNAKAKAKAAPVLSTGDAECFNLDIVGTSSEEERSSSPLPLGIHSRPSYITSSQYDQTAAVQHRTDTIFTHCNDDWLLSSERRLRLSSPSNVLQRLDRNLDGEQRLYVPRDQAAPASPPLASSGKALQPFPIAFEAEEESNNDDDRCDDRSGPSQPTPSTPMRSRILLAQPRLLPIAHEEEEFSDNPDTVPAELPIATWTQPDFISPVISVATTTPMEEENVDHDDDEVDKEATSFLPLPDLKRSPHRRHSPHPPCCSPSKKARRKPTREISADRRSPSISPSQSSSDMFTLDKGAEQQRQQQRNSVAIIRPQHQQVVKNATTTRTRTREATTAADLSVISVSSSDSDPNPNFDDLLGSNGGSGSSSDNDDGGGGGVLHPLLIARSRSGGSSQRRQVQSLADDAAATAAGNRDVGCEVIDLT